MSMAIFQIIANCQDFENPDYRQYFLTNENLEFTDRTLPKNKRKKGQGKRSN